MYADCEQQQMKSEKNKQIKHTRIVQMIINDPIKNLYDSNLRCKCVIFTLSLFWIVVTISLFLLVSLFLDSYAFCMWIAYMNFTIHTNLYFYETEEVIKWAIKMAHVHFFIIVKERASDKFDAKLLLSEFFSSY